MKNIITIALLCMLFSACYKANNPPASGSPDFSIYISSHGSVKDSIITLTANDSTILSLGLAFTYLSGDPKDYHITCSLTNLPPGITCAANSVDFLLNFNALFSLDLHCDTGMYTIGIIVKTKDGSHTYPIRIHILPTFDAAPGIIATYYGSDPCGHFSLGDIWYTYTAPILVAPGHPHWIRIQNFRAIGDSYYVWATISGSGSYTSISVPIQTVNGYTVYGTGGSTPDTGPEGNEKPAINIRDTIIHAGDTQTCITQLRQHK